ncbi:MAG: argininosuccinate lyase [Clostridia bacterium]|nr:argininosuccinate lyase [Clostridia bacterium]
MANLWAGRFSKALDSSVNDFNSSIRFDCRMYRADIKGSIAHARMLGKQGIISLEDSEKIINGLLTILEDIESGKLEFDMTAEDIHMFVEAELTSRIGDAGKRLHTARSRNDQVALDIRLYLRDQCEELISEIKALIVAIVEKAEANIHTVMPGYTHLQRAQPVTFAHYIMAYAMMLTRDLSRINDCKKRMNVSPLGSGALASTTYPLDRMSVADELGFDGITLNSIDGVSDRDFGLELLSALSITMTHLSRFSEEIILWCSSEFGFITLDDAFSTGSSIMPQKKNPDVAELVRGKSGRVFGDLMTLLTVMKGLPLAYNKDMQEDKEAIFDALDTAHMCITTFTGMFATVTVNADVMLASAGIGYINATDCADYLTRKGVPFRDAYKITGRIVGIYSPKKIPLDEISLNELNAVAAECGREALFTDDFYDAINLSVCVNERKVIGGPAESSVLKQLEYVKEFIK